MFRAFLRHGAHTALDCGKLCCTKIEDFGVSLNGHAIFKNVNMHVHCGQLTAIIGPNGAGKSTLLRAILGEVKHIGRLHYADAKERHTDNPVIGYVPQYLRFDVSAPTSVRDVFQACLSRWPVWLHKDKSLEARIINGLKKVKAEHLLERRLGALSGGELQRVLLALALDPLPDLLLLDEPVSGVDHNGLALFYEILSDLRAREDMAIILVSHDLRLVAEHADQVVLLKDGHAMQGTPEKIFADAQTQEIFGNIPVPGRGQQG